jgi:hypothetical protein
VLPGLSSPPEGAAIRRLAIFYFHKNNQNSGFLVLPQVLNPEIMLLVIINISNKVMTKSRSLTQDLEINLLKPHQGSAVAEFFLEGVFIEADHFILAQLLVDLLP